jgi:hypothetical protein
LLLVFGFAGVGFGFGGFWFWFYWFLFCCFGFGVGFGLFYYSFELYEECYLLIRQLGVKALDEKLAKMKNLPAYSTSVSTQEELPSSNFPEKTENIVININQNSDLIQSQTTAFPSTKDEI